MMTRVECITLTIKLNLKFDYSNAYILVNETITIPGAGNDVAKWLDERNKGVMFKNCASFTDCISEVNNTQIVYKRWNANV